MTILAHFSQKITAFIFFNFFLFINWWKSVISRQQCPSLNRASLPPAYFLFLPSDSPQLMTFSTRGCHLFTGTIITNPKTLISALIMILTWTSQAPQVFGAIWKFIQILIWGKFEAMTFGIRGVLANPITFPHYQLVVRPPNWNCSRQFPIFPLKVFSHILPACLSLGPPSSSKIHQNSIRELIE